MSWSKNNYPDSMKKLPVAVRNKAIQIANALLKEKKKMSEEMLVTASVSQAKDILFKSEKKKVGASKKTKNAAVKKVKRIAKNKTKKVSGKKIKIAANSKTTKAGARKVKSPVRSKSKTAAKKNVKTTSKKKETGAVRIINPVQKQAPGPVSVEPSSEIITRGEDLHFIPEHGKMHPVTPLESHQAERIFHHREEVAIHQENQKVKEALATRKNYKRYNRQTGRR